MGGGRRPGWWELRSGLSRGLIKLPSLVKEGWQPFRLTGWFVLGCFAKAILLPEEGWPKAGVVGATEWFVSRWLIVFTGVRFLVTGAASILARPAYGGTASARSPAFRRAPSGSLPWLSKGGQRPGWWFYKNSPPRQEGGNRRFRGG